MSQDYLQALARHILTAVGGFAVARGLTDNQTVETIIGGTVAAIGLVWSLWHKQSIIASQDTTPKK